MKNLEFRMATGFYTETIKTVYAWMSRWVNESPVEGPCKSNEDKQDGYQKSWILIRKPYKRPNKKENLPKSFSRDCLWTLGKGVLY